VNRQIRKKRKIWTGPEIVQDHHLLIESEIEIDEVIDIRDAIVIARHLNLKTRPTGTDEVTNIENVTVAILHPAPMRRRMREEESVDVGASGSMRMRPMRQTEKHSVVITKRMMKKLNDPDHSPLPSHVALVTEAGETETEIAIETKIENGIRSAHIALRTARTVIEAGSGVANVIEINLEIGIVIGLETEIGNDIVVAMTQLNQRTGIRTRTRTWTRTKKQNPGS
jgi:hypothetical protein